MQTGRSPDKETLKALIESGLTNPEIGARYGVTGEAIRQAAIRYGLTPAGYGTRVNHQDYMPWRRVRADHVGDMLARRLRSYSKRQQGKALRTEEARRLDDWISYMDGQNRWKLPMSVHYSRAEGFWLEPRRDGDRNYVCPPSGDGD